MNTAYEGLPSGVVEAVRVEIDKPHEECGVVGLIFPTDQANIAYTVRDGLHTLQHRGQEAAGQSVASTDGDVITIKNPGLVYEVFGGNVLTGVQPGNMAVGHVRYGTYRHGSARPGFNEAGPSHIITEAKEDVVLGHNGQVNNEREIREHFGLGDVKATTDSHLLSLALGQAMKAGVRLPEALVEVCSVASGAMSIVAMGQGMLVGARDPNGLRPLVLGTFVDGGVALASEIPALASMGAHFRREVSRGEVVICKRDGSTESLFPFPERPSALCAFELIYHAAPNGELEGRSIHVMRKRMGELLAQECPVDADVVIGVPESGIPASEGFSLASGIERVSGLYKNRYMGRIFIAPGQDARQVATRQKLAVIQPEVYGKRVALVDDSLIRGTTSKVIVAMLRENGATEVHLRVTCAPYKWSCYYGMDTAERDELIANQYPDLDELCKYLDVDSIGYLSLDGLRTAVGDTAGKLCMACMNGQYPTNIDFSHH